MYEEYQPNVAQREAFLVCSAKEAGSFSLPNANFAEGAHKLFKLGRSR